MENNAPQKETYSDATGRVETDTDFLVPETTDTETPDTEETKETPEKTTDIPDTSEKPETETPTEDPEKPQGDPEKPTPTKEEPKVYAGKYQSVDELKRAYQNLGGNPDRFTDPKALEEAYEYRQAEFTRIQQEEAERKRIAEQQPEAPKKDPNEIVESMMNQVDWSKVEDAKDLGKQLLSIFMQNMPQNTQAPTPEQLVEKIAPMLQEREQKQKALNYIESKVPRLTNDQGFRKAFALHVVGGRPNGTPYPRTNEGLDEAMKDFLSWGKSIAEEGAKAYQTQTQQKQNALPPKEHGGDIPTPDTEDEIDEVIAYHKERQSRLGIR